MDDDDIQNLLKYTDSSNAPLPDAAKRRLRAQCAVRKDIDLIDSSITHQHSPDFSSPCNEKYSLLTNLKWLSRLSGTCPQRLSKKFFCCVSHQGYASNTGTSRLTIHYGVSHRYVLSGGVLRWDRRACGMTSPLLSLLTEVGSGSV